MYCCFTALLRVALADVAIFNLHYNTPGDEKRTRDELLDFRTMNPTKHMLCNEKGWRT